MSNHVPYRALGPPGYHSMVMPGAEGHGSGSSVYDQVDPAFDPDDAAVEPETRQELIDGQIVEALPALPPHSDHHSELDYVLRANVAPGYVSSSDMLTRTSEGWNFATDASIRKAGDDPETGHRHLEELAFEIKYTQSLSELGRRAEQLSSRGVRRVFALCVDGDAEGRDKSAGPLLEWAPQTRTWRQLDADDVIEDPCLSNPVPVRALIDAAEADNQVARALIDKGNPVIARHVERAAEQGRVEGELRQLRRAIVGLCRVLDIPLAGKREDRLQATDRVEALTAIREYIEEHRAWPHAGS